MAGHGGNRFEAAPGLSWPQDVAPRLYQTASQGRKPRLSATGVANVPAIMGKYFVAMAESMADVRGGRLLQ